jgi:hypothetical protein
LALAKWVRILFEDDSGRWRSRCGVWLLGLIAACCTWSALLFVQGHTNYSTWADLLHGQRLQWARSALSFMIAAGISAFVGVRANATLGRRSVVLAVASFLVSVSAYAVFAQPFQIHQAWCEKHNLKQVGDLITMGALVVGLAVAAYLGKSGGEWFAPKRAARVVVATGLVWVLFAGSWQFGKLTLATQDLIASGGAKERHYQYRATMVVDEIITSVREYNRVEGFSGSKQAAQHFIDATAAEAALGERPH